MSRQNKLGSPQQRNASPGRINDERETFLYALVSDQIGIDNCDALQRDEGSPEGNGEKDYSKNEESDHVEKDCEKPQIEQNESNGSSWNINSKQASRALGLTNSQFDQSAQTPHRLEKSSMGYKAYKEEEKRKSHSTEEPDEKISLVDKHVSSSSNNEQNLERASGQEVRLEDIEESPDTVEDPFLCSNVNNETQFFSESGQEEVYEIVSSINNKDIDVHVKKSYLKQENPLPKQHKDQKNIEKFERATIIDPNSKGAYLNGRNTLTKSEENQKTAVEYDITIDIDPNCKLASHQRGDAFSCQGDDSERVTASDPNFNYWEIEENQKTSKRVQGTTVIGNLRLNKKLYWLILLLVILAIFCVTDIKLFPESQKAAQNTESTYQKTVTTSLEEYPKLRKEEGGATVIDPNSSETFLNLGDTLIKLEKYQEAEKNYKKALEIDTNCKAAQHNLGFTLFKQEKYQEAAEEYERAAIIDPNFREAYFSWGLALSMLNNYAGAAEKYEKATIIDPNYKEGYFYWGFTLAMMKNYQEAAEKYEIATKIDPNYKEAYNKWGDALYSLEKYQEAAEKYERAIAIAN